MSWQFYDDDHINRGSDTSVDDNFSRGVNRGTMIGQSKYAYGGYEKGKGFFGGFFGIMSLKEILKSIIIGIIVLTLIISCLVKKGSLSAWLVFGGIILCLAIIGVLLVYIRVRREKRRLEHEHMMDVERVLSTKIK